MEPQFWNEIFKYVAGGGGGMGGLVVVFLIYKYLEKRRNGNPSRSGINNGGVEIIGVKIEAMSKIIESKMELMIDEQKESRKLLSRTFEIILEKPCIRGKT